MRRPQRATGLGKAVHAKRARRSSQKLITPLAIGGTVRMSKRIPRGSRSMEGS
jgi:hypothetical protein